jgi:hypothetical protein
LGPLPRRLESPAGDRFAMTDRRDARSRTPDRAGTVGHGGEVQVRLSGELVGTSRPYPNQRGTGARVYTRTRAETPPEPTLPRSGPASGVGRGLGV